MTFFFLTFLDRADQVGKFLIFGAYRALRKVLNNQTPNVVEQTGLDIKETLHYQKLLF